tara:strand:- start:102 stop:377 length:276 start_codon:yes stop_codon:yes gene_type:complete
MPTLVIKGKITKGYDHWVKVYDDAEDLRNSKYGIKTVYRGHELEDPNTIHVVMFTPNMDVLQQHMENEADLIADAGGDPSPEANHITMCSD